MSKLGIFRNMTKMKYMVYFIHYEELYTFWLLIGRSYSSFGIF